MSQQPLPSASDETTYARKKFFKVIFDFVDTGFVCIARRIAHKGVFDEQFFHWPNELDEMVEYINSSVMTHDVWFCPMTFERPERRKEFVLATPSAWSDLDTCPPDILLVEPTVLIESSENRFQALWLFNEEVEPLEAEDISKQIAYHHAVDGADKSGWDLTQLLRVPYTMNFKYTPPQMVVIKKASDTLAKDDFSVYPVVEEDVGSKWPFPESIDDSQTVYERWGNELDPKIFQLAAVKPTEDWSKTLWNLEMMLCETNLPREDVFSIVRDAACNKYARDGRSNKALWREVCKAWAKVKERSTTVSDAATFQAPDLLSDEDMKAALLDRTFIEDYIDWASGVGDAAVAYHQAGAFTALSALCSGSVRLPTSFGVIVPNLWFLLLADTTLTRKSTALDLTVDLLTQVDEQIVLATDGSIEGLFTTIATRPGQASMFLRDEFSGLLEMMTKRDYYAGMAETLTKLYDGKFQKRVLRRETIEVRDPVLLIFAGGIRTKILQLLTTEHISSGFVPRFIFITAKSDITRLRPLGPPDDVSITGRDQILHTMGELYARYNREIEVKTGAIHVPVRQTDEAKLTPGAWQLYNDMEVKMLKTGLNSVAREVLTPTMDRLAKSGLKAALLIAASRREPRVIVTERDIMKAFAYVSGWRDYSMDVISNIGMSAQERTITAVFSAILKKPGVLRSQLMQSYHLSKREADAIFDTLDQRQMINRTKSGRSERFTATIE